MELDDGTHDDGGGQKMRSSAPTRKRRKRKTKMGSRQRYNHKAIFVSPIKTP